MLVSSVYLLFAALGATLASVLDVKCISKRCQDAASGVLASLDTNFDPCQDFYKFACGHFNKVPSGELLWDYYRIVQSDMDNTTRRATLASVLDVKCISKRCQDAASGVLASLDTNFDPCQDFYKFACGHFNKVPSGELLWDYYRIVQSDMDNTTRSILESPVTVDDPEALVKAKHMHAACMDTATLDARGLEPVVTVLREWGGWPVVDPAWEGSQVNWNKLADIIAEFAVPFVFSITSKANLDNANITAIYVNVPSLSLPVPLTSWPHPIIPDIMTELRTASKYDIEDFPFTRYLIKMATLLRDHLKTDVPDEIIKKDMVDVVLFSQKVAKASTMDLTEAEDLERAISWTVEQLQERTLQETGGNTTLVWADFLRRVGAKVSSDSPVIVSGGNNLLSVVQLVEEADSRIFQNYLMSRLLVFLAPESSEEMRQAARDFYALSEDYPRYQYCQHKVLDYPSIGFSHAVAYQYRVQYYNSRKLPQAEQMVSDLRRAFQDLLRESDWMDEETKQKASEKANAMLMLIGFPTWTDSGVALDEFYSQMKVNLSDHFGNMKRLRAFSQATNLETFGKPRERNDWTQSPLIVNAFYNPINNRVTFPVGMMAEPFFSGDERERSLDYGRIGAIVGHEITHGFDSSGRLYDAFGTLADWWSDETDARFKEKEKCFVEQYNSLFIPEINATVDGVATLKENIADNGGVREAYRAFKKVQTKSNGLTTPRLPHLESFSADQLFFLGYATMWCRAETVQGLQAMQKDIHSPNRFRVTVPLSNMKEFSEAFECPLGSPMNPVHKCVLW